MIDVAIIGGGVSGLAAAYALKSRRRRVVVLERQVWAGGKVVSERKDGFLMEHGPSTIATQSDVVRNLSRNLGIDSEMCSLGEDVRRRYLVAGGRLCGIPVHPLGILSSNYLSLRARLRMLAEPFIPRGADTAGESVAEFFTRRFGHEFTSRVIDPLVGGIYAGCVDALSVTAAFPRLVELERDYGSIACGVLHRRREGDRMPGSRLFSWRSGIATLPRALTRALGPAVRTGVTVRRIERFGGGFRIDAGSSGRFVAPAVIVATQSCVAARLLERVDKAAADAADSIAAPPVAVVFLGYRREQVGHPLDGLGFLAARGECRALTGAQFCSTMFPGRAPEGHVAIAGYFGGARAPHTAQLRADDLVQMARAEFADLLDAHGEPVVARVRHWPFGLPQYEVGHENRVAALCDAAQRQPGLFITGNYFSGPGVASCAAHAQQTAARADAHLRALGEICDDGWCGQAVRIAGVRLQTVRD